MLWGWKWVLERYQVRNQGQWEASRSWERLGNEPSPRTSKKDKPSIFVGQDSFWASDLQNGKIIHLSCFKLLCLREWVTAAVGNQYSFYYQPL